MALLWSESVTPPKLDQRSSTSPAGSSTTANIFTSTPDVLLQQSISMTEELVDLSLFEASPTIHDRFSVPDIPQYHGYYNGGSRYGASRGEYRVVPRACTMKPLPPLPERRFCRTRLDPRRDDPAARCILSRVKRMRAQTVPHSQHNTIQQRRNIVPNPYLTLSAPQQRGIPASPMIWLEDEQVWLIADGRGFDEYYGPSYPSPPEYEHIPPPYARSEPSPRQPESENLPIHGQFLSLMDNERDEDRLSPLFQQAIHAFSPFGPHEPDSSDMLSVPETERDWDTETSRQQSWHSATSSISPFTESQPSTGEGKAWETLAMRVIRPSSAMQ